MGGLTELIAKWNSKRLAAGGAAGYAIYAMAAAGTLNPLSGGLVAGLAGLYILAETWKPTVDKPAKEG